MSIIHFLLSVPTFHFHYIFFSLKLQQLYKFWKTNYRRVMYVYMKWMCIDRLHTFWQGKKLKWLNSRLFRGVRGFGCAPVSHFSIYLTDWNWGEQEIKETKVVIFSPDFLWNRKNKISPYFFVIKLTIYCLVYHCYFPLFLTASHSPFVTLGLYSHSIILKRCSLIIIMYLILPGFWDVIYSPLK